MQHHLLWCPEFHLRERGRILVEGKRSLLEQRLDARSGVDRSDEVIFDLLVPLLDQILEVMTEVPPRTHHERSYPRSVPYFRSRRTILHADCGLRLIVLLTAELASLPVEPAPLERLR